MNMEINPIQPSVSDSTRDRDVILDLLQRPFSSRSQSEQKAIACMTRPMPKLLLKTGKRNFQESWYSRKNWLCVSEVRKSLFCWPCLLFNSKSTTWTYTGYVNMHSFLSDCQKHEKAKSHMESYKTWKTFNVSSHESVDVLFSRARREAVERYNEGVRQSREMLKNLTEAVLYLARQELAFRGHDESTSSLNKGNYRELLQSFCKLDSVFDRRLNGRLEATERPYTGGVFTGVSSDVQNDLIECLDDVIQDEIDKEISDCQFISIQCDETLDISTKEQLCVILRLDKGCDIVERFLKFHNVSTGRTAPALSEVIKNVLSKYGDSLKSKLIMQTYDGAAVMSGHINGLQTLIRHDYPFAFFFHCAAHRLNLVLCQSALNIREVKLFFSKISAFCTFSKPSSDRKAHFNAHGVDIPSPGETRWYYKSRAVEAIIEGFDVIKIALTEITNNPQDWSDETVAKADGLLQSLESFLFCFLLELYSKILQKSSILYDILQKRSVHFSYAVGKIHDFKKYLCDDLRTDAAFEICHADALAWPGGAPQRRCEQVINYKSLYFEVIDNIVGMIENRFRDVESFSFLDLVNPKIFPQWVDGVPVDKIQQLTEKYGTLFDISNLQSQLAFVYKDKDFHKDNSMELLKYIYKVNDCANLHSRNGEIVETECCHGSF